MTKIFFILIIAASITLSKPGLAITIWPKSEKDWSMLPPFCKARSYSDKHPTYQSWQRRLGGDFIHVHHYCAALLTFNDAHRYTKRVDIAEQLNAAMSEIDYVELSSHPNFRLLPHIFKTKADIFLELKNVTNAVTYLNKAIQLNPKFVPAYTRLADIYYEQGQTDEALKMINQALKIKPHSRALNKRLKKLQAKK